MWGRSDKRSLQPWKFKRDQCSVRRELVAAMVAVCEKAHFCFCGLRPEMSHHYHRHSSRVSIRWRGNLFLFLDSDTIMVGLRVWKQLTFCTSVPVTKRVCFDWWRVGQESVHIFRRGPTQSMYCRSIPIKCSGIICSVFHIWCHCILDSRLYIVWMVWLEQKRYAISCMSPGLTPYNKPTTINVAYTGVTKPTDTTAQSDRSHLRMYVNITINYSVRRTHRWRIHISFIKLL